MRNLSLVGPPSIVGWLSQQGVALTGQKGVASTGQQMLLYDKKCLPMHTFLNYSCRHHTWITHADLLEWLLLSLAARSVCMWVCVCVGVCVYMWVCVWAETKTCRHSRQVSCDMCSVSCDTCSVSCDTCSVSCDTCSVSCDTCSVSCDTCSVSCDTCSVSCDTCGVSCDMCGVSWWVEASKLAVAHGYTTFCTWRLYFDAFVPWCIHDAFMCG